MDNWTDYPFRRRIYAGITTIKRAVTVHCDEFVGDLQTKKQVLELWELGWAVLLTALEDLNEEHLLKTITIRNEPHTVIEAIERQMYHYSYHVGQIVYIAKILKASDWKTLTIPRKK